MDHVDTAPVPSRQSEVLAAVQSLTGYHIGNPDSLDDTKLVHYAMVGQGVIEIRRNRIGMGVRKTERVAGLPDAPCGFVMTIPKIPWLLFAQSVMFFREVIRKLNDGRPSEACVQFFFDPKAKLYTIYVPEQKVSAGGVHHTGNDAERDPEGKLLHVADVHSHGSMSAFFSSTDDHDERTSQTGDRLYGVVGNVMDHLPTMSFRARCGQGFIPIPIEAMIEMPTEEIRVPVNVGKMLRDRSGSSVSVNIDPFTDATVPEEWLKRVTVDGFRNAPARSHEHHQMGFGGVAGERSPILIGGVRDSSRGEFRSPWSAATSRAVEGDGSHSLAVTTDAPILVSSTGTKYLDTADGLVKIEIREDC